MPVGLGAATLNCEAAECKKVYLDDEEVESYQPVSMYSELLRPDLRFLDFGATIMNLLVTECGKVEITFDTITAKSCQQLPL